MDLAAHVESGTVNVSTMQTVKNPRSGKKVAVIEVDGVITKHGSSLSAGGSSLRIRRDALNAARDESIASAIVYISSPGGSEYGLEEAGEAIFQLSQKKPTATVYEDMGASAAYWLGSQTRRSYATSKTAKIGSIGSYMHLVDSSEREQRLGFRHVLIKHGELKGGGIEGMPITAAQEAYLQELVNNLQDIFNAAIMRGRKMTAAEVEAVATGRVWPAEQAKSLKLIDGIRSFEDVLDELVSQAGGMSMTSKEVKALCPGCDAEFIAEVLSESDVDAEYVKDAWVERQAEKLKSLEAKNAAAEAKIAEAEKKLAESQKEAEEDKKLKPSGAAPIENKPTTNTTDGTYKGLVHAYMQENKCSYMQANLACMKRHRAAYVEHMCALYPQDTALIKERYAR